MLLGLAIPLSPGFAQGLVRETEVGALLVDARDGKKYGTATYTTTYPDQTKDVITWMTENLSVAIEGSYVYNDEASHEETYGRLYVWEAAMEACPAGWRMPTDEDWYRLSFHFGGNCSSGFALKSDSELWVSEHLRGNNSSFFNVLPAGLGGGNGGYFGLGRSAIFWSATDRDEHTTWDWKFIRESELQRWYGGKMAKHSVRCVQD